ncbi:MAG: hypothetical protein ICV87_01210 [Gemmatimonadetes bacterium]|nr:hypothetical protein [Gemmatimonadota bacterium]
MKHRLGKTFRAPVLLGALVAAGLAGGFTSAAAEEDASVIPGSGGGERMKLGTAVAQYEQGMLKGFRCTEQPCGGVGSYCCDYLVKASPQ